MKENSQDSTMEQNGTAPKVRCPRNQSHLSVYSLSLLVDNQDWMATGPCEEKPIVQGSEAANHGRFPPVSQHAPSACLLIALRPWCAGLSLCDLDYLRESDGHFLTT